MERSWAQENLATLFSFIFQMEKFRSNQINTKSNQQVPKRLFTFSNVKLQFLIHRKSSSSETPTVTFLNSFIWMVPLSCLLLWVCKLLKIQLCKRGFKGCLQRRGKPEMDVKESHLPHWGCFWRKTTFLLSSLEINITPFSHDLSDLELVLCD